MPESIILLLAAVSFISTHYKQTHGAKDTRNLSLLLKKKGVGFKHGKSSSIMRYIVRQLTSNGILIEQLVSYIHHAGIVSVDPESKLLLMGQALQVDQC